ncbi:hypothetical protein HPB49_003053 [Dermacentor silvarum]|uniref:Uncharacterized protein n=1 Tax=Dermacentor silvarum TaxID=543639 RepID=A0ACB8DU30_DERSI|nr:hypothetical protein HPB49_003053 [Dermacentor silvarum]
MASKTTLRLYCDNKGTITPEPIYDNSGGSALLFEARAGALRTLDYRSRFDCAPEVQAAVCRVCGSERETAEHLVLNCAKLSPTPKEGTTMPQALGFLDAEVTPRATATKSSLLEQAVSDTAKQVNIAAASNEVSEKILESRKLKSVDLVERHMRRIREVQPVINAVVDDRYEEAETEAADQLVASGTLTPEQLVMDKPFLGVPLSTKDCYAVKGMLQDSGLVLRKGFRAPQDADGMALLRAASAIPPALTNISELCMWWESYNLHERTNNPIRQSPHLWQIQCAGGEGSLIASAGSVIGVGTDISGSIRMLAFFNGIFDHKPTRGLVSNKGQYPPARDHSLDACLVAGPMCRYAQDLEPMLAIMAGPRASLLIDGDVLALGSPQPQAKRLLQLFMVDWSKVTVYYRVYDLGGTLCTPVHPEMKDCV